MTDLAALAKDLHENAREKGFYAHEDWLYAEIEVTEDTLANNTLVAAERKYFEDRLKHQRLQLSEHYGNRLFLISGEATEAHEEVRSGHGVGEVYHKTEVVYVPTEDGSYGVGDSLAKPEGVLMELADVGIRDLETIEGILGRLTEEQRSALREAIPVNSATTYNEGPEGPVARWVNTAEVLVHKHEFNQKRAAMHGGRKF
jgi:hypothetical protein